jgi:hypothetical protein
VDQSRNADDEHLRLLSIFHYVVAGITAVIGCFPLIHIAFGLFMIFAPEQLQDGKGNAPPDWFGLVFVVVGCVIIAMFWSLAACIAIAGCFLAKRQHYMFCLVVAAIECMFGPFGTVLGVFTIVVLVRDSVKRSFDATNQSNLLTTGAPVV